MKLIIAEKPSLARNIAAGIGKFTNRQGYMENQDYIITWAFGHLFSLADAEAYTNADYKPGDKVLWSLDNLPCFPPQFKFVLRGGDEGVARQFQVIRSLCRRPDVDTVINAGDADREGEIIVRLCMIKSGVAGKSLKRLWLPDQTPETVAAALKDLKDESEYENLANEGFARTYIDWLYGINLTRYATVKSGQLLRVGRVVVPIVKAIYDRDREIENFVPKEYYAIASCEETKGAEVELVSKLQFDSDKQGDAESTCARYNAADAVVTAVKRKKDKLSAGKLYSLSKLQSFLGKKYKMSMSESLEIVQKLYEAGYLTYPRTNSEYLATAEKDKIAKILATCKKMGYPVVMKGGKNIFDDSKIESHSAITPTYKIPEKGKLTDKEYKVYSAVFRRFIAVFCENDCVVQRTEIEIDVKDCEVFTLKGMIMLEKGWTEFDDYSGKDKILPPLEKGDLVNHIFKPTVKKTSPPKHYTIETLNNYLKNPFREDKAALSDDDDSEEYRAVFEGLELGTEATRTGIIDNARKSGYILLKNNVYTILDGGKYLIETLEKLKISMDKYKTAELGKALKRVYRGEIRVSDSVTLAQREIAEIFSHRGIRIERTGSAAIREKGEIIGGEVGKCPVCQKAVKVTDLGWACSNKSCQFSLYKTVCKHTLTESELAALLSGEATPYIDTFISRAGKPFTARLRLQGGKMVFEFPDANNKRG